MRRLIFAAGAGALILTTALVLSRAGRTDTLPIPGEGDRVTVEVLNGTGTDGLARETTRELRRAGIDVVFWGDASTRGRDTTLLLVRRGDSTGAKRVRAALGYGVVALDPDPSRLLDVTVILGADAVTIGLEP